jgi:hypothetical protein
MASGGKGGASALIWTGVGLAAGLGLGWWTGNYGAYAVFGLLFGWMTGLSLAKAGH